MGEVINVIVAVAVVVVLVRWAASGKDKPARPSPSTLLGFRPKTVTTGMVDTVHNMFPDIPSDNIRYDLLRTGSVPITTNTILERGFLPAPPQAYYTLYPRSVDSPADAPANGPAPVPATNASTSSPSPSKPDNLIERYSLQDRVAHSSGVKVTIPEEAAGRALWEDNAEKREASLRERKAQMILAARARLMQQTMAE